MMREKVVGSYRRRNVDVCLVMEGSLKQTEVGVWRVMEGVTMKNCQ